MIVRNGTPLENINKLQQKCAKTMKVPFPALAHLLNMRLIK
jgi:hypothetical protein